jgi:deoxyribonuclease V
MKHTQLPIEFSGKFSVVKAHKMQLRLSKLVIREDMISRNIECVAGLDVAYTGDYSIGAAVVLNYNSLTVVEHKVAKIKTRFPYIPTLLSFREIPPTLAAFKKLKTQPQVTLVDGQGIAHPFRLGFASHLGLFIDKPTIGVAKSLLCGEVGTFNAQGWAPIADRGEVVGAAVASQGEKPICVSVGHKVSLERAIEVVKHCTPAYRIPKPLQAAHMFANAEKRKMIETT